jgi:predicted TIM-barrel fold metal-dependent hydrolase
LAWFGRRLRAAAGPLNKGDRSMYSKDGESYFVVDGHVHFWDGSPANQANIHGTQFIDCFYDYHKNLSPEEYLWPKDKFEKYTEADILTDLFEIGYVDKAIFQPTYLTDFYTNGFNTTEQDAMLAEKYPDKFIVNGSWDPRDEEAGLKVLADLVKRYHLKGIKLYTAEWKGSSRGWKLSDPWAFKYLDKCRELGIKNIHVHKGPTIRPLDRDAFDVADVDIAATEFTDLNFIVEHVGLPRLEDFCWIGTQEPNVYGGLAVAMPFIHTRPRYFAQIIGELLYWIGEDKILFASDYAIWQPKWLVEKFVDFEIPAHMNEYPALTPDVKRKILGLNAAALYDIDVPAELAIKIPAQPEAEAAVSAST